VCGLVSAFFLLFFLFFIVFFLFFLCYVCGVVLWCGGGVCVFFCLWMGEKYGVGGGGGGGVTIQIYSPRGKLISGHPTGCTLI